MATTLPVRLETMKHSTLKAGHLKQVPGGPPGNIALGLRVKVLKDLARALLMEVEAAETASRNAIISRAQARRLPLSEGLSSIPDLESASGISFYEEVRRFEIELISLALKQTAGNQREAVHLLRLKPSTLNAKIKLYKIRNYVCVVC
jgi:DNA-binding NtrC family response regulator